MRHPLTKSHLSLMRLKLLALPVLSAHLGPGARHWRLIHRAGAGPDARRLFAVSVPDTGRAVIVKQFRSRDQAAEAFATQRATAEGVSHTIAPLALSRAGRFIVMPRFDGVAGLDRVADRDGPTALRAPLAWLRDLHARGADGLPRISVEDEYRALRHAPRLDRLAWLPDAVARGLEAARDLPELPIGRLHGDFHPHNILFGPDDFRVIDFAPPVAGPAVLDLGQILAHLDLTLALRGADRHAAAWPRWRDAVLAAYGAPDLVADPSLAAVMRMRRIRMTLFLLSRETFPRRADRLRLLETRVRDG